MTNDEIQRNDEIRMTKPATAQLRVFDIRASDFLRHSTICATQVHGPNACAKRMEALHEPRSAAVPAASCGGVSPPARTPAGTPGALAGEDACATSAGSSWSQCVISEIVAAD